MSGSWIIGAGKCSVKRELRGPERFEIFSVLPDVSLIR
jgi:hypothetical protein